MKINRHSEEVHLSRDTVGKAHEYYVIIPYFKTEDLQHTSTNVAVSKALNKTPKDKLIIYDNKKTPIEDNIITLYEDYENNIYDPLKHGIKKISNYKRIILIYPKK